MLTRLHIRNFKAWKDTGPIPLAPLTVIFGTNSAGKSSLGHLMLALQQTARSSDRKRPLVLGHAGTGVDLGSFTDCIHGHDLSLALEFQLGWALPRPLEVDDPFSGRHYSGRDMSLGVSLKAGKTAQPEVECLAYRMLDAEGEALDVTLQREERGGFHLHSENYGFQETARRNAPPEAPEKFYRFSDATLARYRNAAFLADFALATESLLENFHYLGPVRHYPRRLYQWSGDAPGSVGQMGEYAVDAILAAEAQGRKLSLRAGEPERGFAQLIAEWLKKLGLIHDFSVRPLVPGRREYEVLVRTHPKAPEVGLSDVGFGVSQVLPVLVQAFHCPPHSTAWMEQPEIHLHPQVQAELADVFISAIQARENGKPRNIQLVVESHSEHFLNRLQRRVAEGAVRSEDVAVYFCRRTGSATELDPLRLNAFGEIENWPENFFGDEMADISARTLAAMRRKREAAGKSGDLPQ